MTSQKDEPNRGNWDTLPKAEVTVATQGGKAMFIIKLGSAPPSSPSSWHIVQKAASNPRGKTANPLTGHQFRDKAELEVNLRKK